MHPHKRLETLSRATRQRMSECALLRCDIAIHRAVGGRCPSARAFHSQWHDVPDLNMKEVAQHDVAIEGGRYKIECMYESLPTREAK